MTTKKQITRAETVTGNLVRALEPGFISLVKNPSNRRAFSVIRSEEEGKDSKGRTVAARRVSRRADQATHLPLIQFPEGFTAEQAQDRLKEYGLISYKVTENEGTVQAQRSDLQSAAKPEELVPMKLSRDGVVGYFKRSESGGEATSGKTAVAVVALEFDTAALTQEQISSVIQRNSVDKDIAALDNSGDTVSVLRRSEVAEGEEVRRIEVEPGVVAVITRAEQQDIPAGFVQVINENAYGQWGWGQLDFFASMADCYVTDQLDEGVYRLRTILDRILFYSDLPIDARKTLVSRTLAQYEAFVHSLLDLLPRPMLIAIAQVDDVQRSSTEPSTSHQENAMTGIAAPQNPNAAAGPAAQAHVTRAEMETVVQAAVSAAVASATANLGDTVAAAIKRAQEDAAKAEAEAANAKAEAEKAETERQEQVTRAVADAMKPLQDEIDRLKGATQVQRSDDATETAADKTGTQVKRSADQIMQGSIFRKGTSAAAAEAQ